MANDPQSPPTSRTVVKILKEGYWERSQLVKLEEGSLRVQKSSRASEGFTREVNVLRAEILYLRSLSGAVAKHFPRIFHAWDGGGKGEVGYEMPFYKDWKDASRVLIEDQPSQAWADAFQEALAAVVFDLIHLPGRDERSIASHVEEKIQDALTRLELDPDCAPLIHAEQIQLNGKVYSGPQRSYKKLSARKRIREIFARQPCVRLHGDLFLENILWCEHPPEGQPNIVLVDPVSVLGVSWGPPLFDLVKFETYACGELYAMREGLVDAGPYSEDGAGTAKDTYRFRIRWEDPNVRPFRMLDLRTRFRKLYVERYGEIDLPLYRLLDAYFSLAMALNTTGLHRWGRLLKATLALSHAYYRK